MEIQGLVQNGVVILDEGATLPEGTRVVVFSLSPAVHDPRPRKKRVELPLVSSGEPGNISLTKHQIYEILDEEDIEALKGTWDVPS